MVGPALEPRFLWRFSYLDDCSASSRASSSAPSSRPLLS